MPAVAAKSAAAGTVTEAQFEAKKQAAIVALQNEEAVFEKDLGMTCPHHGCLSVHKCTGIWEHSMVTCTVDTKFLVCMTAAKMCKCCINLSRKVPQMLPLGQCFMQQAGHTHRHSRQKCVLGCLLYAMLS